MVEHHLAKVGVAGSNPVFRSSRFNHFVCQMIRLVLSHAGGVAELADAQDLKSCGGFPPCRFESGPRHHLAPVAQLDRALTTDQKVRGGSTPLGRAISGK